MRSYTWDMQTGKIEPADFPARGIQAEESTWEDNLDAVLYELDEWLLDPINAHDTISVIEETLREKHHDYGEENLKDFGELGILVRASDKIARLKNLLDKAGEVKDESREDTWRDLAGYAIQALIMMKQSKKSGKVNVFEIRKNRLIRGFCPDCGEGALLRNSFWENRLHCSQMCGFSTGDLYSLHLDYPDFTEMVEFLASQDACSEQK